MSGNNDFFFARLRREWSLRLFQQMHQNDDPEWRRASGAARCPLCKLELREHGYDEEHPGFNESFDNRLCTGEVVHL